MSNIYICQQRQQRQSNPQYYAVKRHGGVVAFEPGEIEDMDGEFITNAEFRGHHSEFIIPEHLGLSNLLYYTWLQASIPVTITVEFHASITAAVNLAVTTQKTQTLDIGLCPPQYIKAVETFIYRELHIVNDQLAATRVVTSGNKPLSPYMQVVNKGQMIQIIYRKRERKNTYVPVLELRDVIEAHLAKSGLTLMTAHRSKAKFLATLPAIKKLVKWEDLKDVTPAMKKIWDEAQ